ncbi:MAG: DNA adenine methylase [Candidatus Bathyarchaeia archaeon]
MRYVQRYNTDHYRRIWVRRSTYDKLVDICDKPILDCVDEILGILDVPDRIFSEIKKKLLNESSHHKHLKYAGGDWFIKDELVDIAVRAPPKKAVFVEVFGGSGVMSQFVPRSKFVNVVYNDIDKDLAALHEVVKSNPDLLAAVLYLLPYSRYLNKYMYENLRNTELGNIVGASILFYLLNTSFSGRSDTGFSVSKEPKLSAARKYTSKIAAIYRVAEKFRDVVVESLDFEDLIEKYDSDETLFYLDPPYVSVTSDRSGYYRHGFNPMDTARLGNAIKRIKGYFMLKIHEDNMRYYSSIPIVSKFSIVRKSFMEFTDEDERKQFRYVILTNYKLGGLSTEK